MDTLCIADDILELLRCPHSGQKLRLADARVVSGFNAGIARKEVVNQMGEIVTEPVGGILVTEDGGRAYPIRDGIPVLLFSESLGV